jgi:hypothetical protein
VEGKQWRQSVRRVVDEGNASTSEEGKEGNKDF